MLSLSDNSGGYVVYNDMSHKGVRVCADVARKVIAYVSQKIERL